MVHKKAYPSIFICLFIGSLEGMEESPSLKLKQPILPKSLSSTEQFAKELEKIRERMSILDAQQQDIPQDICKAKSYHVDITTLVTLLGIASKSDFLYTLTHWKKMFLILSVLDLFEKLFARAISMDKDNCLEKNGYLFTPWKASLQASVNKLLDPKSYDLSEFFNDLERMEETYACSSTPS